jgi:hypothetical protein
MLSIGDFIRHSRVSVRMLRTTTRSGCCDRRNGYRSAGYNREPYVECGENSDAWVAELQEPIATS